MTMRNKFDIQYPAARTAILVLLAACILSACTPTRWDRDGLALDYANADWSDCRRQSIAGANRWLMFDPFPRSYFGRDALGRPFTYYRPAPYPNRFMLEQDYLDNCLRARGFRRVPIQPDGPAPAKSAAPPTEAVPAVTPPSPD